MDTLLKQLEYAIPQGQIRGTWWDTAKSLGAGARTASSDAQLQTVPDSYSEKVYSMVPNGMAAVETVFRLGKGLPGEQW